MDSSQLLMALIVLAAAGATMWFFLRRGKSKKLKDRFGPEYDETVRRHGDRSSAESDLVNRAKRVERFHIRSLSGQDREMFIAAWRANQVAFVDDPAKSIAEADALVNDVMKARGYPMADFEVRAADISVDHPHVVRHYRAAHAVAIRHSRGEASTEDLRTAFIHYRELFAELLDMPVHQEVH